MNLQNLTCSKGQCNREVVSLHNHTDYSNIRLLDAINRIEDLVTTAVELGHKGIAITDHESLSAHHKAIKFVEKGKAEGTIPKDFKLILGNEIYLVEDAEWCKTNYGSTEVEVKFYHYLLLAKNSEGHKALRKLSSKAWKNSFRTGLMERVPTEEWYLEQVIKEHPNSLIGTSACLGGRIPQEIIKAFEQMQLANVSLGKDKLPSLRSVQEDPRAFPFYTRNMVLKGKKPNYDLHVQKAKEHLQKAREYIEWNISLFGKEDFYLELQPATYTEQILVNQQLLKFAEEMDLKTIITFDAHYSRPEEAKIHEAFLNAKQGDREVADFYAHTYIHTIEEVDEKMNYLNKEDIDTALKNTIEIANKIEEYSLEQEIIIPRVQVPEFELKHIFKAWYDEFQYIKNMAYSEEEQDRYLLHLVEDGFLELVPYTTFTKERFFVYLDRINKELRELWKLSLKMSQAISSYYNTTARIVDIIWADEDCGDSFETGSLVGFGRGSAVAFLISYLMKITMVNPLEYGLNIFHERHLSAEMGDISSLDIDIDINANKRQHIFQRLKDEFGEENFLQVSTFGTEASRSAVKTACRGLEISDDVANYIASLIPNERGKDWSIQECFYGNDEGREPVKQFIDEVEKYEGLKETLLKIQGLISRRGTHAGGVIILNQHYVEQNALMRSPDGTLVTQFNLEDTQDMGAIKMDLLSLDALVKIQETINYLLENGVIEKQSTLRETFEKYFKPEVLDLTSPEIFELAGTGKVQDLFQFSTSVGYGAITKATPTNLLEMTSINSVMRLMNRMGETPLETFAKFKEDISLWYDELKEYNLNEEEIKILEEHLLSLNGIADTQEMAMLMSMDERIANFNMEEATILRKTIAGANEEKVERLKQMFYSKGQQQNTRKELLDYIWEVQIGAQLG